MHWICFRVGFSFKYKSLEINLVPVTFVGHEQLPRITSRHCASVLSVFAAHLSGSPLSHGRRLSVLFLWVVAAVPGARLALISFWRMLSRVEMHDVMICVLMSSAQLLLFPHFTSSASSFAFEKKQLNPSLEVTRHLSFTRVRQKLMGLDACLVAYS